MKYEFELNDICAMCVILNVSFILMGFWWAPIMGIANCVLGIVNAIYQKLHLNLYIINLAFLILNIYLLTN